MPIVFQLETHRSRQPNGQGITNMQVTIAECN